MIFEEGVHGMSNRNWLQRIADGMELEMESLPMLPVVEIAGDKRVLIEHHGGIMEYSGRQIGVKVRFGTVCICGRELEVIRMSGQQLVISGQIDCVQLHRRG